MAKAPAMATPDDQDPEYGYIALEGQAVASVQAIRDAPSTTHAAHAALAGRRAPERHAAEVGLKGHEGRGALRGEAPICLVPQP